MRGSMRFGGPRRRAARDAGRVVVPLVCLTALVGGSAPNVAWAGRVRGDGQEAARRDTAAPSVEDALRLAISGVEDSVPHKKSPYGKLLLVMLLDAAAQGAIHHAQSSVRDMPSTWADQTALVFAGDLGFLLGQMVSGYRPQSDENILVAQSEDDPFGDLLGTEDGKLFHVHWLSPPLGPEPLSSPLELPMGPGKWRRFSLM